MALIRFADLNPDGGQFERHINPRCDTRRIEDFLRCYAPFNQDLNHLDGIGHCNTIAGWDHASSEAGLPALTGEMDLTGKKIAVCHRPWDIYPQADLTLHLQTIVRVEDGVHTVEAWANPHPEYETMDGWTVATWGAGWLPAGGSEHNNPEWQYVSNDFERALHHRGTLALSYTGTDMAIEGVLDIKWCEVR